MWEIYDGVRSGVADFERAPHYFVGKLDETWGAYADNFKLYPVDAAFLDHTLRNWEIYRAWERSFHRGQAPSAEEALRLPEAGTGVDLVVTDHLMLGMSGTELAGAVRQTRRGVPVLLVSGYAESESLDAELPRLTKPFRKDELAASLSALIER